MSGLEGQSLGEFKILTKIGQGGMGSVYLAEQPALNRRVAVKVLLPELAHDSEFPKRFKREAMLAASINHPGIVQVYAAGEVDGTHYIAMEYVDGESLQRRMEREGRIKPEDALSIITSLAQALDHAWQKARLIHRDVKPSNVLISSEGEVKLADFGMARNADSESTLTSTGMPIGTPLYISPEQARCHKELDFSTDIYSLGCTLYHLLCGRAPYTGDASFAVMLQHVTEPAPAILDHMPECPQPIVKLLDRMVAKESNERHASYAELIEELRHARESISHPAKPSLRRPLALTLFVAAAAGGWYFTHRESSSAGSISAKSRGNTTIIQPTVAPKIATPSKDEAFLKSVAGLPADSQAKRVIEKLKELNRDFDPASATYSIENDLIVELNLSVSAITDLSPIRALKSLKRLRLGENKLRGTLGSLDALQGLPLEKLEVSNCPIMDLSPLRGMPLKWLVCQGTKITDLTPLQDSPIQALGINDTAVSDLSPIRGKAIRFLNIGFTQVTDLSPLIGMPLTDLNCSHGPIRSLSPIAGMALTRLICNQTSIEDLALLRDMPLKEIECDFQRQRDEPILRAIPTLEKINGQPAEDFWRGL